MSSVDLRVLRVPFFFFFFFDGLPSFYRTSTPSPNENPGASPESSTTCW